MTRSLAWLGLTVAALAVAVVGIVHVGGPLGALVALLMAGLAALGAHLATRDR